MKRVPGWIRQQLYRHGLTVVILGSAVSMTTGSAMREDSIRERAAPVEAAVPKERAASLTPSAAEAAGEAAMLAALDPAKLVRAKAATTSVDPFAEAAAPIAETPPVKPAPAPRMVKPKPVAVPVIDAPPPVPTAPPLPFRYVGRLAEGGTVQRVFIARGDEGYAVKPGDVLDGAYRVAEIGPRELILIYLPLDQRQALVMQ